MISLSRIEQGQLAPGGFGWAVIDGLFASSAAQALVSTYPTDHYKTVCGHDSEKGYLYEARALIDMGARVPTNEETLSPAWRELARELASDAYRSAMTRLTGLVLETVPMEVNVFHYGPGAWLGPHVDLRDKLATHILYFNAAWEPSNGGCLHILRSAQWSDVEVLVPPVIGQSAVVVRSDRSWHAVSKVVDGCVLSRRSMTVTFYRPGSISTMWPPGDATPLHDYPIVESPAQAWAAEAPPTTTTTLREL